MKKQRLKILWHCPLVWKTAKNLSAVNIAVSRRCPLFYMAVSQVSPLNMLRSVKSRRYLL
jgi:hypothetical protein